VVKLHAEIARRAEENFFSLSLAEAQSPRWTCLCSFEPETLTGRCKVSVENMASRGFRNALQGGGMGDVYIGGPCWPQTLPNGNA
jgi:hypothetical protein